MSELLDRIDSQNRNDDLQIYANRSTREDREVSDYRVQVGAADLLQEVHRLQAPSKIRNVSAGDIVRPEPITYTYTAQVNRLKHINMESMSRDIEFKLLSAGHTPKAEPAVSRAHRWMWLVLSIFSGLWGVLTGVSLVTEGLSFGIVAFGIFGNIVLALSLFRLGAATHLGDR
jgi:hypothetical protein